jgi:ParB/RepB/Spo0J family partition protein
LLHEVAKLPVIANIGLTGFFIVYVLSCLRMKEDLIAVSELGEKYAALRLVSPRADADMVKSMQKYGQMTPVVCVIATGSYELIDGFKRLRGCRRLNKSALRAKIMEVSALACKAAIIQLNQVGRSINKLEEAMVLQSLHREDGLTQMEIAALLGRRKSWVSRRISLIERLSEEVQEDIKLGLISAVAGRELAKLPRGNQKEAAAAIIKHRLSTREAAKLITYLLSRPRWEYQTILASPWEIVEPKQPAPSGLAGRLISMQRICMAVSEGIKAVAQDEAERLSGLIKASVVSAERAVETLKSALCVRGNPC